MTPESLGGLLTKGLGRLGLAGGLLGAVAGSVAAAARTRAPTPRRLRECGTLLVFVVGGMSLAELREVRADLHPLGIDAWLAGMTAAWCTTALPAA